VTSTLTSVVTSRIIRTILRVTSTLTSVVTSRIIRTILRVTSTLTSVVTSRIIGTILRMTSTLTSVVTSRVVGTMLRGHDRGRERRHCGSGGAAKGRSYGTGGDETLDLQREHFEFSL